MGTVSTSPETLSNNKQSVIQQLIQGQQCAAELQILFHNSSVEEEVGRLSAEELVQQILRSFNESLSVLSSNGSDISQNQATSNNGFPCCDDRSRSEDSSESRKRSPAASKDKRGRYMRKRSAHTWTIASNTMEDGQSWRKYGQKEILNSKHPRSYFRCTRKFDQGCQATRQVQRKEDDARMYQITYIGTHTCKDSFKPPQIIKDSESYESHQLNQSATPRVMKQEVKEEATPMGSALTDMDSMMMWKDIMGADNIGFEYSGYEYGDVVPNVYSCSSEISSRNFEFDNDFQFVDESEFV